MGNIMSGLTYVLAKVGFLPIPDTTLKNKADANLEALRRLYPHTNLTVTSFNKIEFNGVEAKTTNVQQHMLTMHDVDKKFGFRLQPDAIFIHTLAYDGFDSFWEKASYIIDTVVNIVEFTHVNFLGARYINKYKWSDETGFSTYVKRLEFLQPSLNDLSQAGSNLLSLYVPEIGRLQINSGVTVDGFEFAPEIYDLARDFGIDNPILDNAWAHLDFDSFLPFEQKVEAYDLPAISSAFSALHKNIKDSYLNIAIAK